MSAGEKFLQLFIAVALFFAVVGAILLITQRIRSSRAGELLQTAAFLLPAILLIGIGLLYPALSTIHLSFRDRPDEAYVGLENYREVFTNDDLLHVLGNTALWVVITPILATAIGLVYAVLLDHVRFERIAKSLIFMPMAISLVGASLIWKFVYAYKEEGLSQIGIANQFLDMLGFPTYNFLLESPWNTIFLIVILIWVQAGFAMTVLSAAIRAIPAEITEAARLDGAGSFSMFFHITVPSIRPSLIVVLTTISIVTLKTFDIVRTATGGNFETSVLAYEFYVQSFRSSNRPLGAALAVLIFVLVMPIVAYNIRQMRKLEAR